MTFQNEIVPPLLFRPATMFPVAAALRSEEGASLGEVFSFVSGLYFRGKLAYAEAFARPPRVCSPLLQPSPASRSTSRGRASSPTSTDGAWSTKEMVSGRDPRRERWCSLRLPLKRRDY